MKKLVSFKFTEETLQKLDAVCGGNRTAWLEGAIEVGASKLSERAKARLGVLMAENGLSESAMLEMCVFEFGNKQAQVVSRPATRDVGFIAPKGSLNLQQLKELVAGVPKIGEASKMEDVMPTKFQTVISGEPYIVGRQGKHWYMQHADATDSGGKQITEDLAKQYWEGAK